MSEGAGPGGDVYARIRAYGSLAAEIADVGVPGVVAMRYVVYVVTAAQFAADLYAHLLAGASLGRVVTAARRALNASPARHVGAEPVMLQDWVVPIAWAAVTSPAQRRDYVLQVLAQLPVLWVWDNVEPVAGFPEGTPSDWTGAEQQELVGLLRDLAQRTRCKILLTSRRDERAWLADLPARVRLPKMPMREALQFAAALAARQNVSLTGADWKPLLRYAAGNPLTITVLVGQALREHTPAPGRQGKGQPDGRADRSAAPMLGLTRTASMVEVPHVQGCHLRPHLTARRHRHSTRRCSLARPRDTRRSPQRPHLQSPAI